MKERVNQLFKDKLILVMLVLGLLTIVAAAGAVTIRKNGGRSETNPYLDMEEPGGVIAENETAPVAGNSNAAKEDAAAAEVPDEEWEPANQDTALAEKAEEFLPPASAETAETEVSPAGAVANESLILNFTGEEKLLWPVAGNVILGYSMETTTWFPTLEQFKCNPANLIQSEASTPVSAPADARVLEAGNNEEIGNYLTLDLGNGYTAVCGQLKEIPVVAGEYLHKGDLMGYVAEPTKYYAVEGTNLYFELRHEGVPVDGLDYLE